MPAKCLSCGECAVIEDDIEGGSIQSICIECGTVASAVKIDNDPGTTKLKIESFPWSGVKQEQLICKSCGDSLPADSSMLSDVKLCNECQELESDNLADNEQVATAQLQTQSASKNSQLTSPVDTCKSCHGTNLGMDSLDADERLVCRDCGTIAGGEALLNDEFEIMTRAYRNNSLTLPGNAGQPRKLRGRIAGEKKIAYLHNKLCFSDIIKEESLEMFDKLFDRSPIFHTHVTTKEHIAAACVFIVCRQHDIPVSLLHFQKYVERFPVFLRSKKIVLKSLNICLPHMTLSSQIDHLLANRGFSAKIISKVSDILFLCRQAWLTQGRSREGLIIIAAYFAYISSEMSTGFVTMVKFRKVFSFPTVSLLLQAECNSLFLKLASSIPWVTSKNVKSNTLYKYIDDILRFQNSLLQLAFKPHNSDDNSVSDKKILGTDSELSGNSKQKNAQQTESMLSKKRNSYDSSKKEVLLPSILKRARYEVLLPEMKFFSKFDLDSPDLNESEFDDKEISSYLLSPDEVSQLRRPKLKIIHN